MRSTAEIRDLADYPDEVVAKYFVLLYANWAYGEQEPEQLRWRERFQAYQETLHLNAQLLVAIRLTDEWLDRGRYLNRLFDEFFDADFDHPNAGAARAEAIALIGEIRVKN